MRLYRGMRITRENMTKKNKYIDWTTHIDGSRRNHPRLKDAKKHIDDVLDGKKSDGLQKSSGRMKYPYMYIATVLGKDGFRYCVSTKGLETDMEIIEMAESFYGKPMDKILEKH